MKRRDFLSGSLAAGMGVVLGVLLRKARPMLKRLQQHDDEKE